MRESKIFLLSITIFLASISACTYESQTLPTPEFPLSEAGIVNALEESGLPWTVGEIDFPQGYAQQNERILNFTLYRDTLTVGFISSAALYGERGVFVTFLSYFGGSPYIDVYNPPKEDWENIIVFLTLLFGGFKNTHQVVNYFNSELDTVIRHPIEPPSGWIPGLSAGHYFEESAVWEKKVNGAYFRVVMARPIGSENEYLRTVSVVSELFTINIEGTKDIGWRYKKYAEF